jgi:hypothetical protein
VKGTSCTITAGVGTDWVWQAAHITRMIMLDNSFMACASGLLLQKIIHAIAYYQAG